MKRQKQEPLLLRSRVFYTESEQKPPRSSHRAVLPRYGEKMLRDKSGYLEGYR